MTAQAPLAPPRSVVAMVAIVPVRILMAKVMVVVVIFFIVRRADHGMLVLGSPRVHVDIESGGGHFVAHRVFNARRAPVAYSWEAGDGPRPLIGDVRVTDRSSDPPPRA